MRCSWASRVRLALRVVLVLVATPFGGDDVVHPESIDGTSNAAAAIVTTRAFMLGLLS